MNFDQLQWEPLAPSSTGAQEFAYDAEESDLYIRFDKDGKEAIYKYNPVDASEAQGLRSAASVGRFLNYFLKHKGERIQ